MNIGKYINLYSDELRLKNLSKNTIDNYKCQVSLFLNYFNDKVTKPSEISEKMIKQWLLLFSQTNTVKQKISAVKLFYELVGKQPLKFKYITYPKKEQTLPTILSKEEIQKLFNVCTNIKHKVILALLYSSGLRISELINLKWADIDRSNSVIKINQGKGKKDRFVQLPDILLSLLEVYYRKYKPIKYILNGESKNTLQYSDTSIRQILKSLINKAGINKRIYPHLLRHSCFTHMVDNGIDISLIQKLAGHSQQKTTMLYCQISTKKIAAITSPLNSINL